MQNIMLLIRSFDWKLWIISIGAVLSNCCCSGEMSLNEVWAKASTISNVIEQLIPNWHPYVFDNTYPMNSIEDGGNDLFDIGNMIKFYEGMATTNSYLTYGTTHSYPTSSIQVGVNSHPFLALAWIQNEHGITNNYTIQVDGNLGADKTGEVVVFDGNVTVENGSGYLEYHTFQVYNAAYSDATYCEVYFAVSYDKWNSHYISSSLHSTFSEKTDSISNKVILQGEIQNVAFGYALLSVYDGQLITQESIEDFLKTMMLRMIGDDTIPDILTHGSCHQTTYLNDTSIQKIYYPLLTTNFQVCEITVQGSFGYKIEAVLNVTFSFFGSVQIHDEFNFIGYISRNVTNACVSTTGNRLILSYYSYFGAQAKDEVTATYSQYLSTCGQELLASTFEQNITLFGSSNNSQNDVDCFWRITSSLNHPVKLNISRLIFGNSNGYLQICNGLEAMKRIETNTTEPTIIYGNYISIRFKFVGDSNSGILFAAQFKEDPCERTYQLTENESSQTVTPAYFDQLGNSYSSYQCQWNFISSQNFSLIVEVNFEKSGSLYNGISVYDSNSYIGWIHYSNSTTYLSQNGHIRLERYENDLDPEMTVTYRQFMHTCGRSLNALSVPQSVNQSTNEIENCFWTIHGSFLNLTITSLQLEDGDYLEVYDGSSQIASVSESLQSSMTFITKSYLGMNILYRKTSELGEFYAIYQNVICDETYQLNDMPNHTLKPQPPFFLYQQTSHHYYHSPICNLYFVAEEGHSIDMDIFKSPTFSLSYQITVYDNLTLLGSLDSYIFEDINIISRGRKLHLQISYYYYYYNYGMNNSNQDIGLTIDFKQIERTCGGNLLANSSDKILSSPDYPLTTVNKDCVWVIRSSNNRFVQLTINELEIEDGYLQISGGLRSFGKLEKQATPIVFLSNIESYFYYHTSHHSMTVYFRSGLQNVSNSFQATYKEVVCGRTVITSRSTYLSSFYIPEYISYALSNTSCDYIFPPLGDDWITIKVTDQSGGSCSCNIEIFQDSELIGSMDQKTSTISLLYTGSQLRLRYVSSNRYCSSYCSFRVEYRRFVNSCGSPKIATEIEQFITSPGHPYNYGSNHDCVWTITADPQQKINFTLNFLDAGNNDYLEIFEGTKTATRLARVINSPVTFVSLDNSITVHFHSDYYDERKGFKATFVEVANGCLNHSCQNDAICIPIGNGYECVCTTPYKGTFCTEKVSSCLDNNPCGNYGSCVPVNANNFLCFCDEGHSDTNGTCLMKCPDTQTCSSASSSSSAWICEYIFWRIKFLHKWQQLFEGWRTLNITSNQLNSVNISPPPCFTLNVTCSNDTQLKSTRDLYNCTIPYCEDGYYESVLDVKEWQKDMDEWQTNRQIWHNNNKQTID